MAVSDDSVSSYYATPTGGTKDVLDYDGACSTLIYDAPVAGAYPLVVGGRPLSSVNDDAAEDINVNSSM